MTISKAIQDLSILVGEIEIGALIHFEDPNYALLAEAARTIKSILGLTLSGVGTNDSANRSELTGSSLVPTAPPCEDFVLGTNYDLLDFELDFWMNLAEHPALLGSSS